MSLLVVVEAAFHFTLQDVSLIRKKPCITNKYIPVSLVGAARNFISISESPYLWKAHPPYRPKPTVDAPLGRVSLSWMKPTGLLVPSVMSIYIIGSVDHACVVVLDLATNLLPSPVMTTETVSCDRLEGSLDSYGRCSPMSLRMKECHQGMLVL